MKRTKRVSRGRIFSDHTCHVYLKSINVPDHFAISSAHSSCACTVGLNFVGPVPLSEIRGLRLDAVDLYVLQFFFFPHFQNLQFCKVIYSWRHWIHIILHHFYVRCFGIAFDKFGFRLGCSRRSWWWGRWLRGGSRLGLLPLLFLRDFGKVRWRRCVFQHLIRHWLPVHGFIICSKKMTVRSNGNEW